MKTVKDAFNIFRLELANLYAPTEIEALTLLILTDITGFSRATVKAFPEQELMDTQSGKLSAILTELKTGRPLQYITGETEFYGLPFKVNSSVLIPRPETEELVEWVISVVVGAWRKADGVNAKHPAPSASPLTILDIGTGSGCIAISLKKNLPDASVSAIDISPEALKTAKVNAELNKTEVNFIEADILNAANNKSLLSDRYSLIISNPPYVTPADKELMHTNVTDFEPHTALFVPQDDPLLFYKAIANYALKTLMPSGLLFFEINESYGKQTVDMLTDKGFKNIELRQDMKGRDRMVKASV
ncbi:peptide chain release factor N(5)-glutamine methyltransferase [Mucilaginibacter limnophilus]|uniref:Release factor glutamine methyltransferase n=1 Tax=Mucilaginibacter limnophilus TaxID=1932778 RepID=A0A437MT32_9SPHI|nr:peptide chain release factor N(5)-glutamine methyltransferase [Mucilaginibacter limnophilus]RVU00801.1 peptide chain release factor N(5)-glutamine methyltransferase [Mucilaginibacter limnophilus]